MNNICMFSSQTFKAFKLCIDCEIQTNTSSSFCHGVFMQFEYLWLKSWGIPVLLQPSSSLIPVGHRAPYPGGESFVSAASAGRRTGRAPLARAGNGFVCDSDADPSLCASCR